MFQTEQILEEGVDKRAEVLRSTFLFCGAEGALEDLALPESVRFKKGELIYSETSYRRALGILISGKAKAMPTGECCAVLNEFSAGAVFGAAAVFSSGDEYISRIVARTDAEVLFIGEELLLELFSKHPQIAVNYTRFLSERIRFLNGKLGLFTKNDAESRVYEFLRKNSAPCGEVAYTGSMALLARNLGLGRTSLYRALDSLEHKHIITREGGRIKVFCDEKID